MNFRAIIYFFFSLLCIFLCLEFLTRSFASQNIVSSNIKPAFGILTALKANLSIEMSEGILSSYTIATNTKHLRSHKNVDYDKPKNTFRILCLGDSMTFGMGVDNNETYPYFLQNILNKKANGVNFEVINAGNPGWGPVEYYEFYKNEGSKYSPDLLVIALSADEIETMVANYFQFKNIRYEKFADKEFKVFLDGLQIDTHTDFLVDAIKILHKIPFYEELSKVSYLLNLVRYKLNLMLTKDKKTPSGSLIDYLKTNKISEKDKITWVFDEKLGDKNSTKLEAGNINEALFFVTINKLSSLAIKNDAKVLLMKIPNSPRLYEIANTKETVDFDFQESTYNLRLIKPLKKFNENFIPLYFPKDHHWTPAGHKLISFLLFNYFVDNKMIPLSNDIEILDLEDAETVKSIQQSNKRIAEWLNASPRLLFQKAMIYKVTNQNDLSESHMTRYLKHFNDDHEAHFQLGLVYLNKKDPSKAVKSFLASSKTRTDPDAKLLYLLGKAYLQMKNYKSALEILQKTEAMKGLNKKIAPEVMHTLSLVYHKMGNLSLAENYLKRAIEKNPKFSGYHQQLGALYFDSGRYEEALKEFNQSLKLRSGDTKTLMLSGWAYLRVEKVDKAVEMFNTVLSIHPGNAMAQKVLAQINSIRNNNPGKVTNNSSGN